MKKIDLHLHTLPTMGKDADFEFDLDKLQEYVNELSLDAIAITNHNQFGLDQFKEIQEKIQNCVIFPGIEIDFESGHLLLIGEANNLEDFSQKCKLISIEISSDNEITVSKLTEVFTDLSRYLLIPHYDKRPKVNQNAVNTLNEQIFAGEVQSPKKFNRIRKSTNALTPVFFGDVRISKDLDIEKCQGRQTFIKTNSETLSLGLIKTALMDKSKIFLSRSGKDDFFQIFSDGQELANGLNIVIGGRSSGKSFLLNKLRDIYDTEEKSIKYIKQFDLVRDDEKEFSKRIEKDKSAIREEYLKEFRAVVEDAIKIDRKKTAYKLENYIKTLLEFASSEKLQDEFSRAVLFRETLYQIRQNKRDEMERLLRAVSLLLKNDTFEETISKYLEKDNLQNLFTDLTTQYKELLEEQLKKEWINDLVRETRHQLEQKTSSPKIDDGDIDFYEIKSEREKLKRFIAISNSLKKKVVVKQTEIYKKFKIRATAQQFQGAQELHEESRRQISFTPAYKKYNSPIKFLEDLKEMANLEKSELYRYFCKVTYQVLNEYDKKVSGGEMAEFNLLRALQDAKQYEMLLVDEPESSFDNPFLKDNVNAVIKEISTELPVVVVTHNNTVGMLMNPDYVLYTQRKITDGQDEYRIFSGSPGDKIFKTARGEEIVSHNILLDALEAGEEAYGARKKLYDNYKD